MDENEIHIVTGGKIGEEASIRPTRFVDYIGQSSVKDNLDIAIQAARSRGEALNHVLLCGPAGLGKTTLAQIIANELGVDIKTSSGPLLSHKGDLTEILMELEQREVFFIDEIHRLRPALAEILYTAMEDFRIDLIAQHQIQPMKLHPFTLIGATTREDLVPAPLRSRFGIDLRLQFYTDEELATIVRGSAKIRNVGVDDDGAFEIARRSQGTPRIANRLLYRARDFAQVRAEGDITRAVAQEALQMLGVDEHGLDEVGRKLMLTIIQKHAGGPVGLNALAASLSVNEGTIEDIYEPFLMKLGLLDRTQHGRVATALGYKHFGLGHPGGQRANTSAPIRASATGNHLSLTDFGKALLETEDLDPVYVMLYKALLPAETLHRYLLAHWFFDHVGVAAKLSDLEGPAFFAKATDLAQDGRGTPRGASRRYFRGQDCLISLNYFTKNYGDPNQAVAHLIEACGGKNVTDVLAFVKQWPLFGPWSGFKIADMLERVANVPITFRKENLKLYTGPTEGAKLWCVNEGRNYHELGISGVVQILEEQFREYMAPPSYDRPVGVQEVETILCKWHAHHTGHYPVGKDSRELLGQLEGWGGLAERLQEYVPGKRT